MRRSRKLILAGALLVGCSGDGPGPGITPTQLALSAVPVTATAGVPLTPVVVARALDAQGNLATGFTGSVHIALAANPGGATLSGTTTQNALAGVATFSDLTLNRSGAGYTLTVTTSGLTAATSGAITVTPGPVSALQSTVSANPASIVASAGGTASTISVAAHDAFGNPVAGVAVALAASGSGNVLTQPSGTTDATGIATGTLSSTVAASKTVSATVNGIAVVQTASVTVASATASQLVFTTQPSTITAGSAIAPAVAVTVQDAFGNLATGFAGNVTIAVASNPGSGTLTGTTTVAVSAGTATFGDLSIDKAGTGYTLQAAAAPALPAATSTAFDVTTGTAAKLAFFVQPTNSTGGTTITPAIQVEVQDAGGNRVTTATNSVTLVIGANPNSGTLGGTKTVAAAAGVATFNSLSIDSAGTGYTLAASATGVGTGATSTAFNVSVGSAVKLAFRIQPASTTGGVAIAPAIQVEIRDAGGNRVTAATNTVTVAIGTNPNSGTLGGTKSGAAVAGVATFSTLTIDSAASGYALTATAATLTATTSNAFNITVGPAAQLGFRVQPSNAASGLAIAPAVQVEVRDAGGNRVTTASHAITLALQNNPGGGTLSGSTSLAATNGLATFSTLSIDKAGAGYTIQATATPVLTATTSVPFTIGSGAADHLAFFVQPSNDTAGSPITPAMQVEIQDVAGNRVTSDSRSITVAILDNPSGGALAGTATLAAVSGVATFPGLSINKAGTGYSLQATASPALPSALSVDFNIAPAGANQLSFFVQPTTTTAGVSIAPGVQVEVLDAFGNRVGTATNSVVVALVANPGGGVLSGTKTRNASAGVATFNNLSINKSGNGYTIRATSGSLVADTSVAFNITPGPATQLAFTTQPVNTAAGATIPVVVTAQDAQGNTATGFTGNVTMAIGTNPASGSLSGTLGVLAVSGVATFSNLSIDQVGTGYTLSASATGPSSATSGTFNITVGAAAKLAFGQQPTATTGGTAISPTMTVRILDANGNLTASTASVTLAITSGTGTAGAHLSGTVSKAAVAGVAAFNDVSIDSAGTAYTLNATSSGLTADTSTAFNVAVGTGAKLDFLVQPSTTPPGGAITPAVQVEIRDAGGNLVTTDNTTNVVVAIGTNPGGTLSGTLTQQASGGVATFANLSIDNAHPGYTLSASSGSLTGATSNNFDIVTGTATKLGFFQQPSNAAGGATISPAVQVEIQDAVGNPVTTATNSITLSFGANPKNGHLSGTVTRVAVSGVATFNNLSIDSAATGYTLSATSSGLTGTTSGAFNITVGSATKLGFRVQPVNTAGGAAITPAVQAEVRDAGGNRVTTASNNITMAIGTNPSNGTLSGTTTLAAVSGLATFSTLSIDSAGTGYRLSATASGLTSATSNTFNVTVGAAAKLGFLVQPSDAAAGASITPALKVEIRDAGGNRVTTASNSVTLAFAANPGGSTLSGTNPVSAASGVATFANLSINKKGTGYALQATSGLLTAATSTTFNIFADGVSGTLSSLVAATDTIGQCEFSCVAGIHASAVTVTVKDQFGNLVNGAPVTLSANGSGNGFSPSATGNTDAGGVFTAAYSSSIAEAKTISATAGGVGISQTATAAVMPVLVGAGDIADCNSPRDDATASQLDSIPGVVFANGDNAYPNGRATDFTNCYDPTWGRQKARTRPVLGNHEYDSSTTAAPYFAYFGAAGDPLGNGIGYYSFDISTWHIVVLNSEPAGTASSQLSWLQGDLASTTQKCILALWHEPLFTSGGSGGAGVKVRRLWQALEDVGADVVINGHDHLYERFAAQDSLGNANPAGIREFIAGTGGGETHSNYVNNPPNVEASDGPTSATYSRGVLRLTLYDKSYRWEFLHAQGQGTFSDAGTASCH